MRAEFYMRYIAATRSHVEYVKVWADAANASERPATDADRARWKAEYDAFRSKREAAPVEWEIKIAFERLNRELEDAQAALFAAKNREASLGALLSSAEARAVTAEARVVELEARLAPPEPPFTGTNTVSAEQVVSTEASLGDSGRMVAEQDDATKRKGRKGG